MRKPGLWIAGCIVAFTLSATLSAGLPPIAEARRGESRPRGAATGPKVSARVRARATFTLILGSQKPGKFPKALKSLKHQLTRPPFSAFKSFKVVKTLKFNLESGRPLTAVLAGPYVLKFRLLALVKRARAVKRVGPVARRMVRRPRKRYRFKLKLISKRRRRARVLHSSRLLLDKGGTFFVAGPRYRSGTLILGITLR